MNIPANKGVALVVFGNEFPRTEEKFDVVIANKKFEENMRALGSRFIDFENLVEPGSVYEAGAFLDELSRLKFSDGTHVATSSSYQGFELWWAHYNALFQHFCIPYTQYKKLLLSLEGYQRVYVYDSPYKMLFAYYLEAHGVEMVILKTSGLRSPVPLGVFLQILITILSLPVLAVLRRPITVFIGDKFEKNKDYDFRMGLMYEELRRRDVPFAECIRSLETWSVVLQNAFVRRRPVIYSEAVVFLGRFLSHLSGGRLRAKRECIAWMGASPRDPDERFKLLVATHYLQTVSDDIWAIRIMKWTLWFIGARAGLFTAVLERNFHAALGCKLNALPTVGIQHGVASRYSTPYDFLTGFDGGKMFSVDIYGVWSEWWKEYYLKNSNAYKPEQLYVSGPMRPLGAEHGVRAPDPRSRTTRVLFISEQTAAPSEVMPYLRELFRHSDIRLTIKFRPFRDGFEDWLRMHEPDIFERKDVQIVKGGMQETIAEADVVVGLRSTGVLESLLQFKIPIFIYTHKWGDYYGMNASEDTRALFSESPTDLPGKIKNTKNISAELLESLRERYFGDQNRNGSVWAIEQLVRLLRTRYP